MGDTLFAGSCGGTFLAVEAETGALLWSHSTLLDGPPAQFHGDFVITGDLIIAGADSHPVGHLYAFRRDSGRVRWKLALEGGVASGLYRRRDAVLAVSVRGSVVCLDIGTGDVRWRHEPPGRGKVTNSGDPLLSRDVLFVPWGSGLVEALDAETGAVLWQREVDSTLTTSAALFRGELLVGTVEGRLLRLDPSTGEILGWFESAKSRGGFSGKLVATETCLLTLYAPELTGSPTPIEGTPRGLTATATHLYVGTRQGELIAIAWRHATPPPTPALRRR